MKRIIISGRDVGHGHAAEHCFSFSDENIPLLFNYDSIVLDLVAGEEISDEIVDEFFKAVEVGASGVLLVSKSPNVDKFFQKLGLEAHPLRSKGNIFSLSKGLSEEKMDSIFSEYELIMRSDTNWLKLAYMKSQDAMIGGVCKIADGSVFVVPKPDNLDNAFLSKITDLDRWWEKKISSLRRAMPLMAMWIVFFIALSSSLTYFRYEQRDSNLALQREEKLGSWDVTLDSYDLDSALLKAFYFEEISSSESPEAILNKIGSMESNKGLELAISLGHQGLIDKFTARLLKRDDTDSSENFSRLTDYVEDLIDSGDLWLALNRIEALVNIYQQKTGIANEGDIQELMHYRDAILGNYPATLYGRRVAMYGDREMPHSEYWRDDNDYYDLASDYATSNNFDYAYMDGGVVGQAQAMEEYYEERIKLWEKFIATYPASNKSDEAHFNIVLLLTKLSGMTSNETRDAYTKSLSRTANRLVDKHADSHLADDALYFSSIFQANIGDIEACRAGLAKIVSEYVRTDYFNKLKRFMGHSEASTMDNASIRNYCNEWNWRA